MLVLPELEKELKESFEDGLSRKPNWKTLIKIKNWWKSFVKNHIIDEAPPHLDI